MSEKDLRLGQEIKTDLGYLTVLAKVSSQGHPGYIVSFSEEEEPITSAVDGNGQSIRIGDKVYHKDAPGDVLEVTEFRPANSDDPRMADTVFVICGAAASASRAWFKVEDKEERPAPLYAPGDLVRFPTGYYEATEEPQAGFVHAVIPEDGEYQYEVRYREHRTAAISRVFAEERLLESITEGTITKQDYYQLALMSVDPSLPLKAAQAKWLLGLHNEIREFREAEQNEATCFDLRDEAGDVLWYFTLLKRSLNMDVWSKLYFGCGAERNMGCWLDALIDKGSKLIFHGRDDLGLDETLTDLFSYVQKECDRMNISPDQVAFHNIKKLQKRYPRGFEEGAGKDRE